MTELWQQVKSHRCPLTHVNESVLVEWWPSLSDVQWELYNTDLAIVATVQILKKPLLNMQTSGTQICANSVIINRQSHSKKSTEKLCKKKAQGKCCIDFLVASQHISKVLSFPLRTSLLIYAKLDGGKLPHKNIKSGILDPAATGFVTVFKPMNDKKVDVHFWEKWVWWVAEIKRWMLRNLSYSIYLIIYCQLKNSSTSVQR